MTRPSWPTIKAVGENAVLVEYEPQISIEVNRKVRSLAFALDQARLAGVTEIIPAYRSLMVYFDPEQIGADKLSATIRGRAHPGAAASEPAPRLFRVPTLY